MVLQYMVLQVYGIASIWYCKYMVLQVYGIALYGIQYLNSSTRESAILVQGSEGYDKKGKYGRAKSRDFH